MFVSKYGPNDCSDKSYSPDSNSFSGLLLPGSVNSGDKSLKERKEYRDKCRTYRKYSELTPPTISSCYDNYGCVSVIITS